KKESNAELARPLGAATGPLSRRRKERAARTEEDDPEGTRSETPPSVSAERRSTVACLGKRDPAG
ncbi:hypothetical protein IscW_ISCW003571, partial [Ixodes scapularis]